MPAATLVIENISQLATCDPERTPAPGVIANAALAAAGDTLIYVGPQSGLQVERASDCVELDAAGNAVVPGFIDCHTHLIWMGDRAAEYEMRASGVSYQEIAAQGGGIRATVRATAAATVDELVAAAIPRARAMLRGGTTTVEIKSGYGLATDAEIRQLDAARRLRTTGAMPDVVSTYLPLHAAPDGDREPFVDSVISVGIAQAASRAEFVDAFCEQGAFTVDECRRLFEAARNAGLGVKVHAEQLSHSGAAALAAEFGAASADHLDYATTNDMRALAAAGTAGVLLPGASLMLGSKPASGRALLEAGVTVALATDCNPGTCYSESMPLMISLAVATGDLSPAQALTAATRGGALALRRGDRGVLAVGKRCDAVILNSGNWLDVAYHLGGAVIRRVIRAGQPVAV